MQGYEFYRKVEPSARKLWQAWGWVQWLLNPAVAAARTVSQPSNNQAHPATAGQPQHPAAGSDPAEPVSAVGRPL